MKSARSRWLSSQSANLTLTLPSFGTRIPALMSASAAAWKCPGSAVPQFPFQSCGSAPVV